MFKILEPSHERALIMINKNQIVLRCSLEKIFNKIDDVDEI